MYKSIYYDQRRNQIHLWGDGQHDDLGYSVHKYNKYAYLADANGEYTSIDGVKCNRVESWTPESEKLGIVYEYNVNPTTRFLIDKYLNSDDISNSTKVLYLDIEVAKEDKYSTPEDAANTITSITYYATGDERYTCLLLDSEGRYSSGNSVTTDIEIDTPKGVSRLSADVVMYSSERDLLRGFMGKYVKIEHNIITGWNAEFFDMPYLYNRMINVLGYDFANKLSSIGIVDVKETQLGEVIHIAGVTILDYLFLYKKFTYTDQSNYRLDTIAKYELGRGKIEYEGDLDYLYKTDIQKFAKYNIIDVELIVAFEEKLHFIETALGLCHKGHVQHSDIQFTSAYLDGAILTYCKRNGMVASSNRSKRDGQAIGAFVRTPTPGLYNWVYDLDLTSLYPMNIISLNISPETKYCRIKNYDEESFARGNTDTYEIEYLRDNTALGSFDTVFGSGVEDEPKQIHGSDSMKQFLVDRNLSIASNGVTYSKNRQGVIPAILDKWFKERAEYKSLRKQCEREGDTERAIFYDQQQLITKILLNSLYGVLLLPSFRFYDKHNGEAVTLTGQSVIKWATRAADLFYNRELDTHNCEYEIEMENGVIRKYHGFDMVETTNGKKYVFSLTENDEII